MPRKSAPPAALTRSAKKQKISQASAVGEANIWSEVAKKTWRAFVLSALHEFDVSSSALRLFRQSLSNSLRALAAFSDAVVDVSNLSHGILMISVVVSARTTVGILSGETAKPLLLLRGSAAVAEHLTDFIRNRFGCYASVMRLPSFVLSALLQRWVEIAPQSTLPVSLTLEWPSGVTGVKQASITLDTSAAARLAESNDGDALLGIRQHFFEHFRINIAALHLTRVATAVAMLSNDGRLKVCMIPSVHNLTFQILQPDQVVQTLDDLAAASANHVQQQI